MIRHCTLVIRNYSAVLISPLDPPPYNRYTGDMEKEMPPGVTESLGMPEFEIVGDDGRENFSHNMKVRIDYFLKLLGTGEIDGKKKLRAEIIAALDQTLEKL